MPVALRTTRQQGVEGERTGERRNSWFALRLEPFPLRPTPRGSWAIWHRRSAGSITGEFPSFASSFTFDTLLARCTQGNWHPDPKTMLFFNQEDNAIGTEQFRTLRSRLYQMREKGSLKKILVTRRAPEGRKVVRVGKPGAGAGATAWPTGAVDRRRPARRALHAALGTTSAPGLGDYLLGESDEFSIMQRGPWKTVFHSV